MAKRIFLLLFVLLTPAQLSWSQENRIVSPPPPNVVGVMKKYSWHEGCPVHYKDLAYLKIPYWGFDKKAHEGEMIVHKDVANETVLIFRQLFDKKFSIEKMSLIDQYKGSDEASMDENNTSAFNCRAVTGRPGVFSKHSYGKAIDINPLTNPYVTKNTVLPQKGRAYLDRSKSYKGTIRRSGFVYKLFTTKGWTWGGDWKSLKDYQHFQKS